jgi:hypothetical protein
MVPLIAFICDLEPVRQRKKFVIEKQDFSLSCVWFLIFHKNFHSTTVSESESVSLSELFCWIRIQPKHLDYFGFGSTTLVASNFVDIPVPLPYCIRCRYQYIFMYDLYIWWSSCMCEYQNYPGAKLCIIRIARQIENFVLFILSLL